MHLVGNDYIAVERILLVRAGGQGVDGQKPILAHVSGYRALHVVIDDPESIFRVIVHRHLEAFQVIPQKIKAFQRLFECSAHLIDFGARSALIQPQGPGQRRRKGSLDILSWDKVQRLLKAALLASGQIKAHDVVHNKLVIREEKEGRPTKGRRVQELPLLVADCSLNDCQDLVGRIRSELPFWIIQVPQIPLAGLPDLWTYTQRSGDTTLHIGVHLSQIFRGVIHSVIMRLLQQFLQPTPAISASFRA